MLYFSPYQYGKIFMYTCMLSQFKCQASNETSAFCIPKKRHCDGTPDCPGGEDEKDCVPRTCPADWFKCNNSQCIPLVWVCDGDRDCLDESDEQADCPTRKCRENEFRCKNGRCIPNSWVCDGEPDCMDKEDENECSGTRSCNPMYFKCENNKCIPNRWQCDGDDDCQDGSDEEKCTERICGDDEHKCQNGRCIPKENYCDGISNCEDGSDELNCPPQNCTQGQFMCVTNKTCILNHLTSSKLRNRFFPGKVKYFWIRITLEWVCDDDADCGDMSDEKDCRETCLADQSQCDSGDCVPVSWLCDGHPDCRDESDEGQEFCAKHECLPDLFRNVFFSQRIFLT
ncbi:Very low-density lipoprotein receptor [Armadillidium nasatum]|uniref:Very low-density lipoprotein receptor n=1 Tax=Armadillidium nasatum TaxID=96803 RepID=A0A5N5TGU9_9CRUS|nr:Very low-density lipoprotein receptor [Armadillidium nasatum]